MAAGQTPRILVDAVLTDEPPGTPQLLELGPAGSVATRRRHRRPSLVGRRMDRGIVLRLPPVGSCPAKVLVAQRVSYFAEITSATRSSAPGPRCRACSPTAVPMARRDRQRCPTPAAHRRTSARTPARDRPSPVPIDARPRASSQAGGEWCRIRSPSGGRRSISTRYPGARCGQRSGTSWCSALPAAGRPSFVTSAPALGVSSVRRPL